MRGTVSPTIAAENDVTIDGNLTGERHAGTYRKQLVRVYDLVPGAIRRSSSLRQYRGETRYGNDNCRRDPGDRALSRPSMINLRRRWELTVNGRIGQKVRGAGRVPAARPGPATRRTTTTTTAGATVLLLDFLDLDVGGHQARDLLPPAKRRLACARRAPAGMGCGRRTGPAWQRWRLLYSCSAGAGSFLRVVAIGPAGESLSSGARVVGVEPGAARDNVPVVSWLGLRGRWCSCGSRCNLLPAVEAGLGALWAATIRWSAGRRGGLALGLVLSAPLVVIMLPTSSCG